MLAVFTAGTVDCEKILSVSAPALIAVQPEKNGLTLTLAAPDFGGNWRPVLPEKQRFYAPETNFRNAPGTLTVELAGKWQGTGNGITVKTQKDKTQITVPALDGAAHKVQLMPAAISSGASGVTSCRNRR